MNRVALVLVCTTGLLLAAMAGAQDEPLFRVVTNNNLNLRACGGLNCAVVDQIQAGIRLPVYAIEGDWYQVRSKGRFLWLAGWLTTRVTVTPTRTATRTPRPTHTPMPDKVLETEEVWYDSNTGCSVGVTMRPGIRELAVALDGERRREVKVAIFPPGKNTPLPVLGSVEKRYSDADDLYLLQYHTIGGIRWPTGLYRFEVGVDRATSVFGWEMKPANELTFFEVYCDHDAALLPKAGRGPVPTPRPAVARGSLTPDKVLSVAEYYLDPRTGCEIRVSDKVTDGDLNFVLTGDRREVVGVNVFRPEENSPLRISGWNRSTFREDGEPFIWQHYGINTPWRNGLYRLVITLDDRTTMLAWRLERGGDQVIYVHCSGPVPPLTLTPRSLSVADAIIRTDSRELHVDPKTGCGVGVAGFGSFAHFGDVFFDFEGDRQKDVKARIYRPGEDFPLRVHERFSSTISYIQHYSLNTVWPVGLYRLEIELDGEILRLDWRKEQAGPLQILVICDSQHSHFSAKHLASLTPRPTATHRATSTPRPTPGEGLAGTQTDICSSIAALQSDLHRFWSDLREANHGHSATDPGYHVRISFTARMERMREGLSVNWPIESTTARDFEHLIDSGALIFPVPDSYLSQLLGHYDLYELYIMTARVAPAMKVPLVGLGHDEYRIPVSIAQGFAEVARAAVMEGRSIESLVEDCS